MTIFDALCTNLSYDSIRYVKFRHSGLSWAYILSCFAIAVYLLVCEIMRKGAHLDIKPLSGSTKLAIAAPWYQNERCFDEGCRMLFTPDENLPYCERFVKLQEGDTIHDDEGVRKKPCVLYDARDLEMGLDTDEFTAIIPTHRHEVDQTIACPEMIEPETGFGVSHKSYFCNKSLLWPGNVTWDGYMVDPERFRVIIMHSISVDMAGKEDLYFSAYQMQGRYQSCNGTGEERVCEWKKIPCVHSRCGLSTPAQQTTATEAKHAQSSSLLSQFAQENSDHMSAGGAARSSKAQPSSKKSKVKLGMQNHLGFLEFLPNEIKLNSSGSLPGSNPQEVHRGASSSQDLGKTPPHKKRKIDENKRPWHGVMANLDKDIAKTLNLDSTIVQGRYGLVTSVDFLLGLAGISSLDQKVKYDNDEGSFHPRDEGISLEIVFEYLNWHGSSSMFFPSAIPSYTMTVRKARPVRYNTRKRHPDSFYFTDRARKEISINAVRISGRYTGQYRVLDFGQLAIVCSSALGLLAAVRFALDSIATYFLRSSKVFNKYKYEETAVWHWKASEGLERVARVSGLSGNTEHVAERGDSASDFVTHSGDSGDSDVDLPQRTVDADIMKMLTEMEAKIEKRMEAKFAKKVEAVESKMEAKDLVIAKLEAKMAQLEADAAP